MPLPNLNVNDSYVPQPSRAPEEPPEAELPMLAGLAEFFRWWDEFLNIINGPLLLFGAGIALVDLLTDGALTTTFVILLFAWAISQALGIEGHLLGSFARARYKHGWERAGWLAVGVILGVATWQAGDVYAIQQSEHITEAAALAQLGMPRLVWLGWRTFLAVGLVALNGWTRYRAPKKVKVTLADEREQLERELTLEPLRNRLRAQQVGGWRSVAQTALTGHSAMPTMAPATPPAPAPHVQQPAEHYTAEHAMEAVKRDLQLTDYPPDPRPEPTPPTDGGTPMLGSNLAREAVPTGPLPVNQVAAASNVTPISRRGLGRRPTLDRRTASRANARSGRRGNAEQRVRSVLASNPSIDFDELALKAKVSPSTASKWKAVVDAERASHRAAR